MEAGPKGEYERKRDANKVKGWGQKLRTQVMQRKQEMKINGKMDANEKH